MKRSWTVEPSKFITLSDGKRVKGSEMIAMALTVCHTCPVQWECTQWAVEVGECSGTWGVHPSDLQRLQGDPDRAVALIATAKRRNIPVQVAVQRKLTDVVPVRSRVTVLL